MHVAKEQTHMNMESWICQIILKFEQIKTPKKYKLPVLSYW